MPRKPKPPQKKKITVPVNGRMIEVALFPPSGGRKSWYAYWSDLISSRSTGQSDLTEAVKVVHDMLQNGGRKSDLTDAVLTDAEFDQIQKTHYSKKTDPEAIKRAESSLVVCMEAITAFRQLTEVSPITIATPEHCELFQRDALTLLTNWRTKYADNGRSRKNNASESTVQISPNTVLKWSRALRAAFERANLNSGTKCVRGVVSKEKLLTENPWQQFTWIEGRNKPKRHFDKDELLLLLDHFETDWQGVSFAPAFLKVLLWSWARREEVSNLKWCQHREVGRENHFESVGKWGVRKWFQIPNDLIAEMKMLKRSSPFVFGVYGEQLREFHLRIGNKSAANRVRTEFRPENLGEWMYRQVSKWSQDLANGTAYLHSFRKTSLQLARRGEDLNRLVAADASLTATVMTASYTDENDEELRHKSNRMYRRLLAALPVDVATRYGAVVKPSDRLIERLDLARSSEDWCEVARVAAALQVEDQMENSVIQL
jgi:hypothetical protein